MNTRQQGLVYRLLGPLIQIVGIMVFWTGQQTGRGMAGLPLTSWGLGLLALGLLIVIAGLYLSYKKPSKPGDHAESDYRLRL